MSDKTTAELGVWIEDTKYFCPAQCYYYFQDKNKDYFCIYLRWRYEDPWSANLIKFKDETLDWEKCMWLEIGLNKEYNKNELEELKVDARKTVIKQLHL